MKRTRRPYRKVNSKIWDDEMFLALTTESQHLFFRLLTGPEITSLGTMRLLGGFHGLAAELEFTLEEFIQAFEALQSIGMVRSSECRRLIVLPGFLYHDKPATVNVVKSWSALVPRLLECPLKNEYLLEVKTFVEGMGEVFVEALPDAIRNLA